MTSADSADNFEKRSDSLITCILESGFSIADVNGIDYTRDVNVAAQDIINLFEATLQNVERSLLRQQDVDSTLLNEETRRLCTAEGGNEDETIPKDISKAADAFLSKLKFLIDYTEKRINVSPAQQQERDRKLRFAVRSSRKTEMDIKSLNDYLAAQRMEHEKSVDKLDEELNECLNSIDQRAEEINNVIKRIVNDSEMKMVKFYKESLAKQELLRSEIKILNTRLNKLRRSNILMEKKLRDERCKVETQLLDCLAKYDADIGDQNKNMENFAAEFQLLNLQRKMLEDNVMIDLRELHDDLQQEKAEALLKIRNEKVEKFVRNRAAGIIQKAWRAYWERHCAKKKKKSRKK